jgi:hypothetical protein
MLRFRRAAAIAHPEHFVAAAQRFDDRVRDRLALTAVMRRIIDAAPIREQFVKVAFAFDVYGSIQNSS